MGWGNKLIAFFCLVIFLFNNITFAKEIKYTTGPFCNGKKISCRRATEIPTCLRLDPMVHLEVVGNIDGRIINRFQPSCRTYSRGFKPDCIDLNKKGKSVSEGVTLECIEFVQCKFDKDRNKLIPFCSDGKIPKCLGGDETPNCELETICNDGSIPVCDYIWEAYSPNTNKFISKYFNSL